MDNKPNYSVLCLVNNATEDIILKIINYIYKGIKVVLISNREIKFNTKNKEDNLYINLNIKDIEVWNKAINNGLLEIIVDTSVNLPKYNEYIDGNITEEIKEYLHNTTFNINQFLIEHSDSFNNIIVKAGAGSGKTKTMIDRIMYLKHMESDLDFSQIGMITFTNAATNEMKKRLSTRISTYYSITKNQKYLYWLQELNKISINTIHRFAKNIISKNPQALGLSSNFTVSNFRYRKKKLLEKLIHRYNEEYSEKYLTIKHIPQYMVVNAILKILDDFDNRAVEILDDVKIEMGNEPFSHMLNYLLRNLVKELNEIKISEDKLETSDLIKKLRIISLGDIENIDISYKYLFIDEFQDTDMAQVEFINWIMKKHLTKVFIVGDIKQSIYRFRGADYTAFELFIKNTKELNANLEEFTLNTNYRSNKELVESLNTLFLNINNHVDKFSFTEKDFLKSFKEKGQSLTLSLNDMSSEDDLVKNIREIIKIKSQRDKENHEKMSIAILTRSNNQVKEISEILSTNNIYCNVEIQGDFFRHRAVIEFYSLVRGLIYRNVPQDLYALLNSSYGNLKIDNNAILKSYTTEKYSMKSYLSENIEAQDLLNEYYDLIDSKPVLVALKLIVEKIKPHLVYGRKKYRYLKDKNDIELLKNIKLSILDYEINLDHLLYLINKNFSNKYMTLFDIEEYLRINISSNKDESRKKIDNLISLDAVNCMTVHKAKGLEFDVVIIPYTTTSFFYNNSDVNLIIKEINSKEYHVGYNIEIAKNNYNNQLYSELRKIEKEEIIGEETRLLYVATTRAKEMLIIHSPNLVANSSSISNWINLVEKGGIK